MTNYSELAQIWQHLHALAPEVFLPITDTPSLRRATDALKALDREMGEKADHPLRSLADQLMARVTSYEEAHTPIPDVDAAAMLAFLMEKDQLTQQRLAQTTGINQATISQLLSRKRPFTADHARALAQYFKTEISYFI
jgi:HTH-type transcriptional regulator/antitoxin HigA